MSRKVLILALLVWVGLMACSFSLLGTPVPTPTQPAAASPTSIPPSETSIIPSPTVTPLTSLNATSLPGSGGIIAGAPSGPYAVILVAANDVLNIRSAPGVASAVIESFPPNYTAVMRSGPSSRVVDALWVEVQTPSGGKGWVNAKYLSEYVTSAAFCADPQVTALLQSLNTAIVSSNGTTLSSWVSPSHGMDVRYIRDGRAVNYDQQHAKFVFETTFAVNWGLAPGSGLEVIGSFHDVILPDLLKVFGQSYTLHCNELKYGGATYQPAWPYAGTNFYSVFFRGTEPNGNMDWHTWVVGIEYVGGKPYVFALLQFFWEP
jgi:hypothetical protein